MNYALAIELNKKAEKVQVATLLTVTGEEAQEVLLHLLTGRMRATITK